jgi:hypothetical protein
VNVWRKNNQRLKPSLGKSVMEDRVFGNEVPKNILERMGQMKRTISEIRLQCEELRATVQKDIVKCSVCGRDVEADEGACFKGSDETRVICKKCFREMLK